MKMSSYSMEGTLRGLVEVLNMGAARNGKGFLVIIPPFLCGRVCLLENSTLCHKVLVLFLTSKVNYIVPIII